MENTILVLESYEEKQRYVKQLRSLWRECFGDTEKFMDYYFDWKLRDNRIYICLKDGIVAAMLHLNPYNMRIQKKTEKLFYIVGVATKEEYRKKGIMRSLITKVMKDLYKEGSTFVYLMPAKEDIYRPFDFRFIYSQRPLELTGDGIYVSSFKDNPIEAFNRTIEQAEKLSSFASEFLNRKYNVYTCHDKNYFAELAAQMESGDGEVLILRDSKGIINGYLAYMFEKDTVEVIEVIVKNDAAENFEKYFEEYLYSRGIYRDIKIKYCDSTFLENTLWSYSKPEEKPVIMGRTVDCMKMLELIRTEEPGEMIIRIRDSIIKENNTVYKICSGTGGSRVWLTDEKPQRELDIAELTEIIMNNMEICINEIV